MRVPKRKSEEFRKYQSDGGPLPMTQAALDQLHRSLSATERELPALIEEVQRTGAFGDFSENAEYQAAKYLLRRAHGRIAALKDKIKRAVLITHDPRHTGWIELGSTVTVESNGKQQTFTILGSQESDPLRGKISTSSPLGKALMHRTVGDKVIIETRKGGVEYKVISIL